MAYAYVDYAAMEEAARLQEARDHEEAMKNLPATKAALTEYFYEFAKDDVMKNIGEGKPGLVNDWASYDHESVEARKEKFIKPHLDIHAEIDKVLNFSIRRDHEHDHYSFVQKLAWLIKQSNIAAWEAEFHRAIHGKNATDAVTEKEREENYQKAYLFSVLHAEPKLKLDHVSEAQLTVLREAAVILGVSVPELPTYLSAQLALSKATEAAKAAEVAAAAALAPPPPPPPQTFAFMTPPASNVSVSPSTPTPSQPIVAPYAGTAASEPTKAANTLTFDAVIASPASEDHVLWNFNTTAPLAPSRKRKQEMPIVCLFGTDTLPIPPEGRLAMPHEHVFYQLPGSLQPSSRAFPPGTIAYPNYTVRINTGKFFTLDQITQQFIHWDLRKQQIAQGSPLTPQELQQMGRQTQMNRQNAQVHFDQQQQFPQRQGRPRTPEEVQHLARQMQMARQNAQIAHARQLATMGGYNSLNGF